MIHTFAQKFPSVVGVFIVDNLSNINNYISIGNHMISSAIWDKSARVNFSKANQFVVFEKFTSADLSQIA